MLALWAGRRGNRLCSGSRHAAEVDEPSRRCSPEHRPSAAEPAPHEADAGFRRYLHRSSPASRRRHRSARSLTADGINQRQTDRLNTASQPRGRETRTASSRRASVGDLAVLVTGRSVRTGRVSRWWRVPAGTHPWVALAVMTLAPGTARVGDADTTPSHTDGPVGSQNEGIPNGWRAIRSSKAVRFGDRGGRGVHVHLRPETGAVMLWPSASAVGWLLMMTALIVLARSGTARWEREQERGAGTGTTRPTSEPTMGPAPSRGSPG